jgi:hypothetical protein
MTKNAFPGDYLILMHGARRVRVSVDAVCAYGGKGPAVLEAFEGCEGELLVPATW